MCHSGCALGNLIYVFGGFNATNKVLNSIERMNAAMNIDGKRGRWDLVQLKAGQFPSRIDPVFCPISDTELLVFGGFNGTPQGDGHIYDIRQKSVTKII